MTTDSLQDWIDTYVNDVPNVVDDSGVGPANVSDWNDLRVTNKLDTPGLEGPVSGTGFTFTFNDAVFQTQLENLIGGTKPLGIEELALAWGSAITSSAGVVVALTSIGAPSNITTWSAISSTVIDPVSVIVGQDKIRELLFASTEKPKEESDFPVRMREAFLLLTITTTGLDSVPSGSGGPFALVDPARAVA